MAINNLVDLLQQDRRLRFIEVGAINAAVGYGTYALFIETGSNYFVANFISTVIGVLCSYILNKFYTFKSLRKSFSEFIRFVSVYLVSFIISNLVLYILIGQMGIDPYIAGVLNLVIITVISWLGHKYYSFK